MVFKKSLVLSGVIGLVIGFIPASAKSQSITQLIEQLIMDKEKLSELKTLLQDMKNSYQIIDQGYSDIKNIVQGNFNLHKTFLAGLLSVSPSVRNYTHVSDIIQAESSMVSEYQSAYSRFAVSNRFSPGELSYINNIYSLLLEASLNDQNELSMVLSDGALRMSDGERLKAIDNIYRDIQVRLTMLRTFNDETSIEDMQRAKTEGDLQSIRNIYGIGK